MDGTGYIYIYLHTSIAWNMIKPLLYLYDPPHHIPPSTDYYIPSIPPYVYMIICIFESFCIVNTKGICARGAGSGAG